MDTFLQIVIVWFVTPFLLLSSFYLSVRLGWPQFCRIGQAFRRVLAKNGRGGGWRFGNFSAVAMTVGGNLGAGTIAGTALAIKIGGPGAILWMVIVALLGGVIKLCCASLGALYQERRSGNEPAGGVMFYMSKGLSSFSLGAIYAIFLLGTALTAGNFVQVHAFVSSLPTTMPAGRTIAILLLLVPTAYVVCGGLRRLSRFMCVSVPIIACVHLAACIIGIVLMRNNIIPVLANIVRGAVAPTAIVGGAGGAAILATIQAGILRGLFATDVGQGLAAIAHGRVEANRRSLQDHAREQGIIALLSPLIVAIVCAVTGVLILCAAPNFQQGASEICVQAFQTAFRSDLAGWFVPVIIYFFAITTIIAWSWFADHAFHFFHTPRLGGIFRVAFIALLPVGAFMRSSLPWMLADICVVVLVLTNIFSILALRKKMTSLYAES
ncbi:MAG: amino acid carrier protein [Puniceicoccales bacterium]|jgi:AGCS family alanine or glycine:cation symporter|nr:amino acid carrier protein [Puniceicoccales bacterium]